MWLMIVFNVAIGVVIKFNGMKNFLNVHPSEKKVKVSEGIRSKDADV